MDDEAPAKRTKQPSIEIKVDQVRELADFLYIGSHRGRMRVALVHPAEDMNENAANALLKGLEEPPASAMFILVSHRPAQLLPTIRSRCVSVPVGIPAREAALAWLEAQGLKEAERWLAYAGGAPLRAVEYAARGKVALGPDRRARRPGAARGIPAENRPRPRAPRVRPARQVPDFDRPGGAAESTGLARFRAENGRGPAALPPPVEPPALFRRDAGGGAYGVRPDLGLWRSVRLTRAWSSDVTCMVARAASKRRFGTHSTFIAAGVKVAAASSGSFSWCLSPVRASCQYMGISVGEGEGDRLQRAQVLIRLVRQQPAMRLRHGLRQRDEHAVDHRNPTSAQ